MKKLFLTLMMAFLLVSCGGSDTPPDVEDPDIEPDVTEKTIFYDEDIATFSEDSISHTVDNGVSEAKGTYSGRYVDNGIVVVIEVVDSNIMTIKDMGYSDNVELQIQAYDSTFQLDNKTFNFLITGAGNYWFRRWERGYKAYSPNFGQFSVEFQLTGTGYKTEVFFSYDLLGTTPSEGYGNIRLFFALRNRASESINIYKECDFMATTYSEPNTWFVVDKNNKMTRRDFDSFKFGEEYSYIFDNLAKVTTSLPHHNVFSGAPAFVNSNVCLASYGLADELFNSSYVRGNKANTNTVAASSSGYLVLAANAFNVDLNNQLVVNGWQLLKGNCPDMLTVVANNSHDFNQLVNYYFLEVSSGQSVNVTGEWAILFAKYDESLPTLDYWNYEEIYMSSSQVNDEFYSEDAQECTVGPNIVVSESGRLFCSFTLGGPVEPHEYNYWYLAYSDNNGKDWVRAAIIDTWLDQIVKGSKHIVLFESNINITENNELFLFLTGRENTPGGQTAGCYQGYVTISNIEEDPSNWEMSKYTSLGTGFFFKNTYRILSNGLYIASAQDCVDERYNLIYASTDKGVTWELYSKVYAPQAFSYDEGIIMEKDDGTLWLTFRTRKQQMYETISTDGGKTWSVARPYFMPNTDTRFAIKELPTGDWVMVYNNSQSGRTNMTMTISRDEGKTWENKILLHERHCSYPDIVIYNNQVHVVFDDGRYSNYAWRYEDNGQTKTWGYIYYYSIDIGELLTKTFSVLDINELTVITRCRERGLATLQGSGTQDDPYLINNYSDFKVISNLNEGGNTFINQYIKLNADITGLDRKIGIFATPFAGTFDGNNHTLTVNYKHGSAVANQGVFGTIGSTALIKDLTVKGQLVSEYTGSANMGGVVGVNNAGTIQNCDSYVNMTLAGYQCGGIVGRNLGGSITDCNNFGNILTTSNITGNNSRGIGGIAGYLNINAKTTITNCNNFGKIESSGTQIGGIVGFSNGAKNYIHEIINCRNEGEIVSSSTINATSNEGVGGMIGFSLYTKIKNSTNIGDITAKCSQVAGIVGKVSDYSVIEGCTNSGNVIGYNQVGGIAGRAVGNTSIIGCTNNGAIQYMADTTYGQIFGYSNSIILENNTENGSVSQYTNN